jgi:predicted Zn-dependent protease
MTHLATALGTPAGLAEAIGLATEAVAALLAKDNWMEGGRRAAGSRTCCCSPATSRAPSARHARRPRFLRRAPPRRRIVLGTLAAVLLGRGRAGEAIVAARAGLELLPAERSVEGDARLRLTLGEALHSTGDAAAATAVLEDARARLLASAGTILDPALPPRYLERVPEHARIVLLTERL